MIKDHKPSTHKNHIGFGAIRIDASPGNGSGICEEDCIAVSGKLNVSMDYFKIGSWMLKPGRVTVRIVWMDYWLQMLAPNP